jgi:hypothetical protein
MPRSAAGWFYRFIPLLLVVALSNGCGHDQTPIARDSTDAALFGPSSMRLHPIFTQLKNWTGNPNPDGIEALVELQDQFGDPTKASGKIIFELYQFKKFDPQRKGTRLCNPWVGDLSTLAAQRDRWNRTSRTYGFQLAGPVSLSQSYVLTAEFQMSNGGRLYDQLVIQSQINPEKFAAPDYGMPPTPSTKPAATAPVTEPGMRTPQP